MNIANPKDDSYPRNLTIETYRNNPIQAYYSLMIESTREISHGTMNIANPKDDSYPRNLTIATYRNSPIQAYYSLMIECTRKISHDTMNVANPKDDSYPRNQTNGACRNNRIRTNHRRHLNKGGMIFSTLLIGALNFTVDSKYDAYRNGFITKTIESLELIYAPLVICSAVGLNYVIYQNFFKNNNDNNNDDHYRENID